ncbi:MAG: InlB B-repeat-containing protein [Candidatus Gracilibacteria bacterium]|nr:InlB B-repeat-containing protein [Candidatus Gracilibacteria bacterium]
MYIKYLKNHKIAFTLVELIVTIVILAILGTIAFISFQGYSKNARDTQRIADINHVEKSLGLFVVNTGFYPIPDKSKDITYMGGTAWIEGTLGDTVLKNIDKVSKTPLDPLTLNEYTYSITPSKTEYQIGAISEVGGLAMINKTYAADLSKAVAYIKGNYNEKITRVHSGNTNLILAMPSIVITDITDPKLENILPKKILVFNNYGNIPHSYNPAGTLTGELDYNPTNLVVYSGTTIDLTSNSDKIAFVTNLQDAYSGTFVESNASYTELMNIDPGSDSNSAIRLLNSYISNNVGGITGLQSSIVYNDCTLDGETIVHGQTITAYSENSILVGASYECTDRTIERSCNNGILSGDDSYIYITCIKGTPTNCTSSGSYMYNGHTYSIPALNHGASAIDVISSNVTETTGIYTYTLTSVICNDGSLINPIESGTTAVVSCNTGYITNGTTCVGETYTVTLSANGGTAGTTSVTSTYNESMPIITVLPTKVGYTFNGYFSAISGGTKYYNADGSSAINYLLTSGTTLYAQWTANTYTVTLSANGGTAGTASVTSTYNTSMPTISVLPTRTGYTFNGYYSATSGGTKYYNSDGSSATSYLLASGTTLYAQWTASTYIVTFDANGGTSGTTSITVTYGTVMPQLPVPPSRTGYTFNGYFDSQSGGTKYYNADGSSAIIYDLISNPTLYAQWIANTYTITFNANGGSLGTTSVIATYGLDMPILTTPPSRTGYTFNGYFDSQSGGTKYYNTDGSSANTFNLTTTTILYAQWLPSTYTVTFNANGGSLGTTNVIATYGLSMPTLETLPTYAGYTFMGYYSAITGGIKYYNADNSSATIYNLTSNTTLYAQWGATISACTGIGQVKTANTTYGSCDSSDIIVCSGNAAGYIIAACNVGTNISGTGVNSYGYYFQWGNNGGTPSGNMTPSTTRANVVGYGPLNYYSNTTFIGGASLPNPYDWAAFPRNTNLWGDVTNTSEARQGPCINGYHIPSNAEWTGIVGSGGWGSNGITISNTLKLPMAGGRNRTNGNMYYLGTTGLYWSSSILSGASYYAIFSSTIIDSSYRNDRAYAHSVRCIKN